MQRQRRWAIGAVPVMLLTACGGGGGSSPASTETEDPDRLKGRGGSTSTPTAPTTPTTTPVGVTYGNLAAASLGVGASLNGAIPFPADNPWNTDISGAQVDPNSTNLINSIGADKGLYRDFGSGTWDGAPIGIPYMVVSGTQAKVTIEYNPDAYGDESDAGPFPMPLNAPIEGAPNTDGDRHVLVVDKDNNRLYEIGRAFPQSNRWVADAGAIFHANSNNVRPTAQTGWTSADAAGLPIFPGLVRYDEASKGAGGIRHALRFTAARTRRAFVPPATHYASANTDANLPPMGMRVRLKASFVIPSTFSNEAKAILTALKTYGMFLADNGSDWFMSGAPDSRWDNDRLRTELASVKGRDLEVVKMTGMVTQV